MTERLHLIVIAAMVLGTGLVAGTFLAFSTFVMAALDRRPPHDAIRTMQAINRTVLTPAFMGVLFGTAVLCAVAIVLASRHRADPGSVALLVAALLYLAGVIGVTVVGNVPLNVRLDRIDAGTLDHHAATRAWSEFLGPWLRWNHLRTIAGIGATIAGLLALIQQARG